MRYQEKNYKIYVADYLNCKRTTYASWETGHIILPLNIADELAILYNVPISYILGLKKCNINGKKIKMIDATSDEYAIKNISY